MNLAAKEDESAALERPRRSVSFQRKRDHSQADPFLERGCGCFDVFKPVVYLGSLAAASRHETQQKALRAQEPPPHVTQQQFAGGVDEAPPTQPRGRGKRSKNPI